MKKVAEIKIEVFDCGGGKSLTNADVDGTVGGVLKGLANTIGDILEAQNLTVIDFAKIIEQQRETRTEGARIEHGKAEK